MIPTHPDGIRTTTRSPTRRSVRRENLLPTVAEVDRFPSDRTIYLVAGGTPFTSAGDDL